MLSSPLLVKCFFGTDLRVLIILYIDVDKGRLTTNYDKTILVRGGSSLAEITFVGSLVDCTWDKLQYLFWRWCWQIFEEKIQRQKHHGPWGVVVGGDHLCREGNLGREFNCRKEIPDPDATILATDPVLAEVGGNSRGQLGQKRKLQEWEINDFRQWHLSKINVCLRVAPHLLLVGTFYLGQLNILSIMHWRIRGQHCEIPPDNHHQVPWSY